MICWWRMRAEDDDTVHAYNALQLLAGTTELTTACNKVVALADVTFHNRGTWCWACLEALTEPVPPPPAGLLSSALVDVQPGNELEPVQASTLAPEDATGRREWVVSCRDLNGMARQLTVYQHEASVVLVQPRPAAVFTAEDAELLVRAVCAARRGADVYAAATRPASQDGAGTR